MSFRSVIDVGQIPSKPRSGGQDPKRHGVAFSPNTPASAPPLTFQTRPQSVSILFPPKISTFAAEPEPEPEPEPERAHPVADPLFLSQDGVDVKSPGESENTPLAPTVKIPGKAEAFELSDSDDDSALPIPKTKYRKKGLCVHPNVKREAELLVELLENAIYCYPPSKPPTITKDQKEKIRELLQKPEFQRSLSYLDEIVGEDGSVDREHKHASPLYGRLEEAVYGRFSYNSEDSSD